MQKFSLICDFLQSGTSREALNLWKHKQEEADKWVGAAFVLQHLIVNTLRLSCILRLNETLVGFSSSVRFVDSFGQIWTQQSYLDRNNRTKTLFEVEVCSKSKLENKSEVRPEENHQVLLDIWADTTFFLLLKEKCIKFNSSADSERSKPTLWFPKKN